MNDTAKARVNNIRRKIRMAEFLRDQLIAVKQRWTELEDSEILIQTAALLEGCLHCLWHCLDILGQAIASEHPGLMQGNRFYLKDVVGKLPPGDLKVECDKLLNDVDIQWLRGFVNYSKHHDLMELKKIEVVGSSGVTVTVGAVSGRGPIPLDVLIHSFEYEGKSYGTAWAQSAAVYYCDLLTVRLESIITKLR